MHGGDRNRTSPFAFTGNKFEFRALGSSMSLAFPNTVLNTIVAEAVDELAGKLEEKTSGGADVAEAVIEIVKESYSANKQVCFSGDNYDEAWHAEAEQRGLKNLRTTPDALPEVLTDQTVAAFENYDVLSKRELESRYEVWIEQYAIRANIEAETDLLDRQDDDPAGGAAPPGADRGVGRAPRLAAEVKGMLDVAGRQPSASSRTANAPNELEGMDLALHARDKQIAAMAQVREAADKLEKVVADDLWPLPKYEEMLFIK